MDAVEAPTEVAVRYIVSDLIYPLVTKNQPHYRVRWKYYRRANDQTDEPRKQLLQDVPKLVRGVQLEGELVVIQQAGENIQNFKNGLGRAIMVHLL